MSYSTKYSDILLRLEAMERDAKRDAGEYANGDDMQSMYQDGRAAGFREALALLRAAEKPEREYQDTRDRFSPWNPENWELRINSNLA